MHLQAFPMHTTMYTTNTQAGLEYFDEIYKHVVPLLVCD
jgi:hypothetical protein